jgi:hypothetical protein
MYSFGIMLGVVARRRIGLSRLHSRALALLIASPLVSAYTLFFLDDKALMFTLPLTALIVRARWPRAITTGIVAAWAGVSLPTLSLLARRNGANANKTSPMRLFDIAAMLAGLIAFAAVSFAAGHQSAILLTNRGIRESQAPFAYSIWRYFGEYYMPVRFAALAVLGATLLLAAYRFTATYAEAFVALTALMLLASTNTVPGRAVAMLPLGILAFRSCAGRWRYLAMLTAWSTVMFGFALSMRVSWAKATIDEAAFVVDWVQVVLVNLPLLVVIVAVARRASQHRVRKLSPSERQVSTRVGSHPEHSRKSAY